MRDLWDCWNQAIRGWGRRLFSANADAVATATTAATLRQASGRASTVVDGQPLGLPGQKVAGHPPVSDGRQVRQHLVVLNHHWIIDCSWNAIPLYFPIKVENRYRVLSIFYRYPVSRELVYETKAEEVLSRMHILFCEGEINSPCTTLDI